MEDKITRQKFAYIAKNSHSYEDVIQEMTTLNSFLDERTKKAKESAATIFTLEGYNKAD
jgi:hypothetical protein